jgi:FtsH-binding integral membrane protein
VPPADKKRRAGLYWIYFSLLAVGSVFWLAVASPIIRPTLPSHPEHLLFCIFAGMAIADAAAHAIDDIAAIWKPHDLGGAQEVRRKFSVSKLLAADLRGLASHLSVIPFVGLMAFGYTLLTPHIEERLFSNSAAQGAVFWNFMSQIIMGGTDVFGFFLSQDTKSTLQQNLHLAELQPRSFEAGAILAGLKLYGLLIFVSALRVLGAPVVILRTWFSSRKRTKRRKQVET